MKVETVLPFGKLDPGLRAARDSIDLSKFFDQCELVEALGYNALSVTETKLDPFVQLALGAQATNSVELHTAVAIAFPRSPTVTAQAAWTLQALSGGRLNLGLGTQVKGHIERRFGMEWFAAGPWIREYVLAVRELWRCWQEGDQPSHHGDRYDISLMGPLFDPGPIEHPVIPITLAAVKPYMCEVAGEVADGVRPHPICTPKYISSVMVPAIERGCHKANRDSTNISISVAPLVATAENNQLLAARIEEVRARVAFYASTPAYRPAFAINGLEDLCLDLSHLSQKQNWDEMPARITDEVLYEYACVGTYDEIGKVISNRYNGLVSSTEFSIPLETPDDHDRLRDLINSLQ